MSILRLKKLVEYQGNEDPEIGGLSSDSRLVKQGDLFFAIPGLALDGRRFIEEAIAKGAHAIITSGVESKNHCSIPIFCVEDIRKTIPEVANRFYSAKPKQIAMVTGTNGKSSTVSIYQQLLFLKNIKAASIGTLGVQSEWELPFSDNFYGLTTPDPLTLHKILSQLAKNHFNYVALEATSIGLDQFRLSNIPIIAASFTNFSQDHLDYHLTMEAYFKAKTKLFHELLPTGQMAVLNIDCPQFEILKTIANAKACPVLSYGMSSSADLRLSNHHPHLKGQEFTLTYKGKQHHVSLPLLGGFQAYNVMNALGMLLASGFSLEDFIPLVAQLKAIPGRLEQVDGLPVFVDYSHKPGALESALLALRPHTKGKIVLVFGCGGNRDRIKRPLMGKIAEKFADVVIVTDDNPRRENPQEIRAEILSACKKAIEIGDRRQAICKGIQTLRPEDVLLVAGKGNEVGQIIGDEILPFSDIEVVKELVERS